MLTVVFKFVIFDMHFERSRKHFKNYQKKVKKRIDFRFEIC